MCLTSARARSRCRGRDAGTTSAARTSPRRPHLSADGQGRWSISGVQASRACGSLWRCGGSAFGSSKAQMASAMFLPPTAASKVSGVPQSPQKPRATALELWKRLRCAAGPARRRRSPDRQRRRRTARRSPSGTCGSGRGWRGASGAVDAEAHRAALAAAGEGGPLMRARPIARRPSWPVIRIGDERAGRAVAVEGDLGEVRGAGPAVALDQRRRRVRPTWRSRWRASAASPAARSRAARSLTTLARDLRHPRGRRAGPRAEGEDVQVGEAGGLDEGAGCSRTRRRSRSGSRR